MATKSNSDRLSYGITLLIFGLLFLLDRLNVLNQIPYGSKLVSVGSFFLIAGIVFLATQAKKVLGWVFLAVGILLNADLFFGWIKNYSPLIVPLALIIVGVVMVFSSSSNKK